jgi:hypothetical protein
MARNSHDIERVFKLQKQIHLLSSWLIHKLDVQADELAEKEKRILFALSNGDLARHDLFISRAAQRLKHLLGERTEVTAARDKVRSEYDRQRLMLQTMERRLAEMRGEEHRHSENRELDDIVERFLRRSA